MNSITRIYTAPQAQRPTINNYYCQQPKNDMDSSVFKELFDTNHDGQVSKEELLEGMKNLNSSEQNGDNGKAKGILDGIGSLLGGLGSSAAGILGALKLGGGEDGGE